MLDAGAIGKKLAAAKSQEISRRKAMNDKKTKKEMREGGIEPPAPRVSIDGWQRRILPLNHSRLACDWIYPNNNYMANTTALIQMGHLSSRFFW